MSDKLISQYDEDIPIGDDVLIYEEALSPGVYKKTLVSNIASDGGTPGTGGDFVITGSITIA